MNSFISSIEPKIEHLITEFQIDSFGVSESGYKLDGSETTKLFQNYLLQFHPHAIEDFELPIEGMSFHPADGITYLNDTIVVGYGSPLTDKIKEKYRVPQHYMTAAISFFPDTTNLRGPSFTIRYDIVNGESYLKVYDQDVNKYPKPPLPEGSIWATNEGVGINITHDERENIIDYYFLNPNREVVREFLGDLYPEYPEDFEVNTRGYGIVVDIRTNKILKAKRYVFMRDKGLFDLKAE